MEDEADAEKVEEVRKHLQLAEDEIAAVQSKLPNSHLQTCAHQA